MEPKLETVLEPEPPEEEGPVAVEVPESVSVPVLVLVPATVSVSTSVPVPVPVPVPVLVPVPVAVAADVVKELASGSSPGTGDSEVLRRARPPAGVEYWHRFSSLPSPQSSTPSQTADVARQRPLLSDRAPPSPCAAHWVCIPSPGKLYPHSRRLKVGGICLSCLRNC